MGEVDLRLIDTRLSSASEILKQMIEEHGEDILEVIDGVDIDSITALTGYDGNTKNRKYLEFLNSNGEAKLQRKDDQGRIIDMDENSIFKARPLDGGVVKTSDGRLYDAEDMTNALDRLKNNLQDFGTGGRSRSSKAISAQKLSRVRQFMTTMNEVFGFNSPEQLEMFIAAWLAPDTTTRLSGIPGTGKTTLIECAALMFGNSYGFEDDTNSEYHQLWDTLRTAEEVRSWEDSRFREDSYKYPFTFILRDLAVPEEFQLAGKKSRYTLNEVKNTTRSFLGEHGFGGKMRPEYFRVAQAALSSSDFLVFVTEDGVIPSISGDAVENDSEYTPKNGWFRHPPMGGRSREYAFYQGITISALKKMWSECEAAYNAAPKGEGGVPQAADDEQSVDLPKAMLYFNHQPLMEYLMQMLDQAKNPATSMNERDFVGAVCYDSRVESASGLKRVDSEMRREIGIAKVDKDKRAEQILYGVDITAEERDPTGRQGLTKYEFTPYPRPIVTQPIKFFNEVNRSQASVEDAILGLIAEKEVEYRGEVFKSPNFTAFMDTNPHVGGNDLAFTDRIDMELMFPSALLDQRYKILQKSLSKEATAQYDKGVAKPSPRTRVMQKILQGEVTPLRYEELVEIWKDTKAVAYETSGYSALMDIAILSVLFSQRFGVHEPEGAVAFDFQIAGKAANQNQLEHQRNTGDYANSLRPVNSSGYFIDASVSESKVYRNDPLKSQQALARGHGAMALMDRVLAFRFTNSLAKLSRSLAYLRGNAYVTRKEVMDCLPYVVGHRMGRAKGDDNKMEYGLRSDAAALFSSGQEFVREAIVKGYIERTLDSFGSRSMGVTDPEVKHRQSRWVEWDSMLSQARADLAASRTYAEFEQKMWAIARLASGDGNPSNASGTGDPMPYLIYRLVLMEEIAATDVGKVLHPFISPDEPQGGRGLYEDRIGYYQDKVSVFLTTQGNFAAHDVAILRRHIALDRWLTTDDKRGLLGQVDSILDGITGSEIPERFGPDDPRGEATKLWGLYGACTDRLPEEFADMDLADASLYLGFPVNDFIRTHTWYGGSYTGRASDILYAGSTANGWLTTDKYQGIKQGNAGSGAVLSDTNTGVSYPVANKQNIEQNITLRGVVRSDDELDDLKQRFSNLLNDLDREMEIFAGVELNIGSSGTPKEMSKDEIINQMIDDLKDIQSKKTQTLERNLLVEVGNIERNFNNPLTQMDDWDRAGMKVLNTDDDRLRLYITLRGNRSSKYVEINLCLASAFVHLDAEGNLSVVSITNTQPLGQNAAGADYNDLAATYDNRHTFFDLGNMTLDAALMMEDLAARYA